MLLNASRWHLDLERSQLTNVENQRSEPLVRTYGRGVPMGGKTPNWFTAFWAKGSARADARHLRRSWRENQTRRPHRVGIPPLSPMQAMPGTDGLESLRALRVGRPGLARLSSESTRGERLTARASEWITAIKPVPASNLDDERDLSLRHHSSQFASVFPSVCEFNQVMIRPA